MASWEIGDRIGGRWEVHRVLRGGMGVVYVVYDHEWEEVFAAKTFQDEVFALRPAVATRFEQEARAWVALDFHPNIVRARMVHQIEGRPLLFLEYVPGGDLSAWIGTPRITEDLPLLVRFAVQFCDGMMHARSKSLHVHRDVKPQNCLISQEKTLKITDFGLAMVLDETREASEPDADRSEPFENRTAAGAGTPAYMAPEQFEDANSVDVRADIYSFGVMLFQMLTGDLPFTGETWMQFRYLHKFEPAPVLDGKQAPLAGIVRRCLEKDPSSRYEGFAEVRAALAAVYRDVTGAEVPAPPAADDLNAEEWNNKGLSLHHLRRFEQALSCFDGALSLNARSATILSNKGVTLGQGMGKWQEALACFEQAIALDPGDPAGWSNKGMALRALHRPEEALPCYDRAIALRPHGDAVWSNKGVALKELGRAGEALACLKQALALNARSAETWSNMGQVLADGFGKREEALECHARAVELDPGNELLICNRGACLLALGRASEALACFDQALDIRPLDIAWLNKGAALALLGGQEKALACYDRAIELNPSYAKAWTNKGNTLARLGRPREAVECYDRALDIQPEYAAAWFNKAVALLKFDREAEAIECLERAARLGHEQARRALAASRGGA